MKNTAKYFRCRKRKDRTAWLLKTLLVVVTICMAGTGLRAQAVSGDWDAASVTGATGYDGSLGNGVIQLLDTDNTNGCQGAAVHETSSTYDPSSGAVFDECYQVFFGCPGNDEIGSDDNGDGMAFSFWHNSATYNINNGQACGGGLGYMGAASDGRMITIEFDTWSSEGGAGFDAAYDGGTTGSDDQVAIHFDGLAFTANKLAVANPGNLDDGLYGLY